MHLNSLYGLKSHNKYIFDKQHLTKDLIRFSSHNNQEFFKRIVQINSLQKKFMKQFQKINVHFLNRHINNIILEPMYSK